MHKGNGNDDEADIQSRAAHAWRASNVFNLIGGFFSEALNLIIRFSHLSSNSILRHISPLCPPIAYLLYAVAELVKGLVDLILLCIPAHFTHNESEVLSVSERILRAMTSFIIAGLYGITALLFLHLNPIGWIFATMGTGMGWIKNDRDTDRHYFGLFVFVGMILLTVNTFVFSPILFPSLGLYSIAAAGYACMIPSFIKGVVSLTEAIYQLGNYLGKKLSKCFCSPAPNSGTLAAARKQSPPLSPKPQPSSSSNRTLYGNLWVFIGNPTPSTKPKKADKTHRLGWRIPVIF